MNNLEIWDKVWQTNPDETTPVEFGARKFTAIDAYAQIKRATELWGPYGSTWGFKELHIWAVDKQVYIEGTFSYPKGQFPVANNISVGKDSVKKLTTDTLTKALSMLGFNADVFLGLFDDNKYVAEMRKKNPQPPKGHVPPTDDQKLQMKEMLADAGKAVNGKFLTAKDAKKWGLTELDTVQFQARYDELNKQFSEEKE